MNSLIPTALAAALFACLPSAVAAQDRQPVRVQVRHGDLDLSRADHRAMLDARLRRAAHAACGQQGRELKVIADIRRCEAEMRRDGSVQIAALVARAPVALAGR